MASLFLPAEYGSNLLLLHADAGVFDNQLELVLLAGIVPRGTRQGDEADRDPVMWSIWLRMLIDRPPGVADQIVKDLLKNQSGNGWDEILRLVISSDARQQ